MSTKLDKAIAAGLLFLVALTALMFGTVEAWSVAVFKVMMLLLVLLWAMKAVVDKGFRVEIPKAVYPIAGLLVLGLVQSIAVTGSDGRVRSLSMDFEATRGATAMLFFLLLAMVLAASFLGGKRRLRMVATFLVIYGAGLALFSIIQHFAWNGSFYWFRPNTQSASPFGPFANHNHFAGHMEMLALIPLGLLAAKAIPRDRRLLYGYAAALMGVAVVMSLSRAGMIALCASILFVALWGLSASEAEAKTTDKRQHSRPIFSGRLGTVLKGVGAVACVVLAIALGIAWTGADPVINRVVGSTDSAAQESFYSSRGWIWSDTIALISANPITGVGLGAYETAFPVYSKSDGTLLVNYAHNDYLQILADGGIVGGALAVWLLVLLWRSLRQGAKSRDTLVRGLSLGFGASLLAILVHSIFDFNLQLPANSFLFLMISTLVTCLPVQAEAPVKQPAVQQKISLAARAAR